jgi:hypothetical protein
MRTYTGHCAGLNYPFNKAMVCCFYFNAGLTDAFKKEVVYYSSDIGPGSGIKSLLNL